MVLIFEGPVCFSIFDLAYLVMMRIYEWFTWIVLASSFLWFFTRNKLPEAIHDIRMCLNCSKTLFVPDKCLLEVDCFKSQGTHLDDGGWWWCKCYIFRYSKLLLYHHKVSCLLLHFLKIERQFYKFMCQSPSQSFMLKNTNSPGGEKLYQSFKIWCAILILITRLETWATHLSLETMLNTVEHLRRMRSCSMQELFLMYEPDAFTVYS